MTLYRGLVWGIKGFNEYTNSGFIKASEFFNSRDLMVSLVNRAVMVTGSNSGIGKVTALELAKRGATVYMVCRNREKAEAVQREIIHLSQNTRVFLFIVDLSQPRQVHAFARQFLQSNYPLDILVNNAGCMVNTLTYVEGNIETNFATNTLGPYILTKSLIPILMRSQQPRVIMVTSGGMLLQKLKPSVWENVKPEKFDGQLVYAQNKRQQVVLTEILAKQYPMIYFASMHPGWADTPAVQTSMPKFRKVLLNSLRTSEQGADTLVWLCCYPQLETATENSSFFQDRKAVPKHLPLADTECSVEDKMSFFNELEQLHYRFMV